MFLLLVCPNPRTTEHFEFAQPLVSNSYLFFVSVGEGFIMTDM